nr:PREDICTED: forkhead box protein O4-like [Lepisosteus oculatus]
MEEEKVPAIAEIDPDFEPQSRPRSCTWPLPRPDISTVKQEGADGGVSAAATPPTEEEKQEPLPMDSEAEQAVILEGGAPAGVGGVTPRKGSSRRNAWGNQSYADLISQAIENSPEKRLTLAQIYDWMVKTVPYFKDKGDSNSSAGWKVVFESGAQGGGSPSTPSGFSNSLFQPQPSSSPGRAGPFGGHVPSTLEALLTSDSPPPSDVMMTQVDPLMPSQGAAAAAVAGLLVLGGPLGGRGKAPGQHPLEKGPEQSSLGAALSLPLQQQQHALSQLGNPTPPQQLGLGLPVPGLGQDSAHLSALKAQLAQGQGSPSAGLLLAGGAQPTSGLPGMVPFGSSGCFLPGQDKLPTDLDIDMFTENLDCDVDYIINSDLMDGEGIDFNFDPILNASQSYPSSSTTQGSSHSWVPG